MTTGEILGRDDELGYFQAFLDRPDPELRAVVLEGEAGIGKSTLWAAGVAEAQQRGFRVLSSRPAEAERKFAHVVLADLLEDVVDEVLPKLPAPRRGALEGALLMGRAPEDPLDPRAVGVALRTCIQVLAEKRPLLLAVDDSQWVDSSSGSALAFALRRLHAQRIFVLLARRLDEQGDGPGMEEALDSDALERLRVGPLSIGALRALLQRRLDRTFARPTLLRLHEISGGNPFYALQLARGLRSGEATGGPVEPFRVPETLERLVGARLAGLGGATGEALLLTAAHGRPSPALLGAAGISPKALEPAFAAQVVELSDEVVRFTHPLLASVLYQEALEEERRRVHGCLAAVVDDPVERARHLALSSEAPDEELAAALEEAADMARSRAAITEAAELAEHALRLTPPDVLEIRHRRTIAAARARLEAADTSRARALVLDLLSRSQAGGRAEALVLLSDIEDADLNLERAIDLRMEALEAAAGLAVLQAEIHQWLAQALPFTEGAASGDRHAETALELAEALDDDVLRAGALSVLAFGRFRAGIPGALSLVDQATRLTKPGFDSRMRREITFQAVSSLVWSNGLDRARVLLEGIDGEWSERDERVHAAVLWSLAKIEFHSGRFQVAGEHAELAREIGRQYMSDDRESPGSVWLVALIATHRGQLDRARALAEYNRPHATLPIDRSGDDGVLGLVELWSGHPGEAARLLAAAEEDRLGAGVNEPAMLWWRADYAEALLALGRVDEAAALVDAWEAKALLLGRHTVLAQATRCRGLVAAARGNVEEALAELARAVAQHEAVGDAFGRARALLALGITRRRARQKRAAREAMEAALDVFDTCGAVGWAEKARAELGAIGGRTKIEGLTPAEGRIASLVAEGRTNRDVAAALFLTEQTVATALTRVYRKLGVRSRAELAHRQGQDPKPAKS